MFWFWFSLIVFAFSDVFPWNFFSSWNRPFLDQLAILQSFPNGTMMVLALAKLRGKTVKLFYSMLLPSFSLSLSLSLSPSLPPSLSLFLSPSLPICLCVCIIVLGGFVYIFLWVQFLSVTWVDFCVKLVLKQFSRTHSGEATTFL